MGKRMHQRVALVLGLLFLILAAEGILVYKTGTFLRAEEQERIGALAAEAPQDEQEYIEIFQGKNSDGTEKSEEQKNREKKEGSLIEEKYGYSVENGQTWDILRRYLPWMCVVLVAGILGVLAVAYKSLKESKDYGEELERTKEQLHELEVHFKHMKKDLIKEENDTKTLITDISHQLKNPIASLKMSCELLDTTNLSPEEQREFLHQTYEEVSKLEVLLNSLMNLSKLESKMIQINPEEGSLKETLRKAVSSIYMKAADKQMEICMDDFEDEKIPHDLKWTVEVFVNILDNAVKYSPAGSKIQIRVSKLVSCMLVEIEDEGIGIAPKETHEIFKRFYRGNHVTVQNQEGSGVGLYLARRILEQQGGTICVKAGKKKGSVFQITLMKETGALS